jgi:flagellar motor switch protein FliN
LPYYSPFCILVSTNKVRFIGIEILLFQIQFLFTLSQSVDMSMTGRIKELQEARFFVEKRDQGLAGKVHSWRRQMSSASEVSTQDVVDQFAEIPVTLEARFHSRLMDIREVLAIQPGAVVQMEQPAGETLSIYVGNVLLALAEVIVVDERLAIRITEFLRGHP